MKKDHKNTVYSNCLDFLSGLRFLFLGKGSYVVHYFSMTFFGKSALGLLKIFGYRFHLEKLTIDYSKPMEGGGGFWYWQHKLLNEISASLAEQLFSGRDFLGIFSEKIKTERRRAAVQKLIAQEIQPSIQLALMAREKESPIVFSALSDLFPLFSGEMEKSLPQVRFLSAPRWQNSLIFCFLKFCFLQAATLFRSVFEKKQDSRPEQGGESRVAVQYAWGLDPSRLHDLWWYEKTHFSNNKCLLYFDRGVKGAATDEIISHLKKNDFQFVICNQESNQTSQVPTSFYASHRRRYLLKDFASLLRGFRFFGQQKAPYWQIKNLLFLLPGIQYARSFLEEENIRLSFNTTDVNIDFMALASDLTESLCMGTRWSYNSFERVQCLPLYQLNLVWGEQAEKAYQEIGVPGEALQTGCIYDQEDIVKQCLQKAEGHRHSLQEKGAHFILSIFDKTCSEKASCQIAYHVQFYEALFSYLEKQDDVAFIIKSKGSFTRSVFSYSRELHKSVERLIASGKVLFLDGKHLVYEAAYASSLAVGLSINSAIVVAGLKGTPFLVWDPAGSTEGPFQEAFLRDGWQREENIFSSLEHFINAIDLIKKGKGLTFDSFQEPLDPFRDGMVAERVGYFVNRFLEKIDSQAPFSSAFEDSLQDYKKTFLQKQESYQEKGAEPWLALS